MTRTDAERFEALFNQNYGDVLAYAIRRTPSRADAEDIVAETFAVAWRRLGDVPEGDRARLWLFGTARLVRLNHGRGRSRQRRLLERLRGLSPLMRRGADHGVAERDQLHRALQTLSETDREVLQLHVWEGLGAGQIGVALDISAAAVWKRLQRARDRLEEALADEEKDRRRAIAETATRSPGRASR